jgi:ketosteroid isomerase-like protein
VVSHPFALPQPSRLVGRAEIAAHFEAAARLPLRMRAENLVVHETGDPEVVVAEFDYVGAHAVTARPFAVSCVFVVRARAGEIVESRDYVNLAAFAALLADPSAAR